MSAVIQTRTTETKPETDRRFHRTAWRWHFYAGLYVAPFLLMLAITGLIMLWSSVLLGRDGEKAFTVTTSGPEIAVSAQADAAAAAVPGGAVIQYIAPRTATQPAVFQVKAGDLAHMVAVDPHDGQVLGQWARRDALYDLADTIHGTLLIGDLGDRLIEIAAGFGVMLVVTGLYMWWPRNGTRFADVLVPRLGAGGRSVWKSLHLTIGFYVSIILLIFLISGLTWSGVWGEKLTQAWSTFPAEKWDNVPLSDETHAALNHGGSKEVPWTLEQTPMPASGSDAGTPGVETGRAHDMDAMDAMGTMAPMPGMDMGPAPVPSTSATFGVDQVVAFARKAGFAGRFQLNWPSGSTGVWTISRDTMSNDSANPLDDRTMHLDQYTGNVLADVGFADYGVAGKAMAAGIAFHEGDMGAWNVALLTVFCLSVIFLSASGVVMWWKRRPKGAGLRLIAPQVGTPGPLWKTGAFLMLAVALIFPLSGAVLAVVIVLDLLVVRQVASLKRMIG
ncbi:PepSY-associated TM helix domain-containing protein [Rhizobium halophytocola]|uniref:Iron-regulated membrane protein n=1 Tax=Rhizobium halophytocola TaxID=735519 RepID=A0ABS4E1U3_9HYPH|nr:PepSY domain-containing protein [Rhizobium halophytocola]MBP1851915.1 putative iron-regulated membrane protein [Rhizobium halophytocola]